MSAFLIVLGVALLTAPVDATTLQLNGEPSPPVSASHRGRIAQAEKHTGKTAAPQKRTLLRSETINYGNWSVACRVFSDAPKQHQCDAQLRAEQKGSGRIILVWTLQFNKRKQLVGALQTLSGVLIEPGVELVLPGTKTKRKESRWKFTYKSCEPNHCQATRVLDDTFIRDAEDTSSAAVVIQASDGKSIRIDFPTKGFGKAYAQLRKNGR